MKQQLQIKKLICIVFLLFLTGNVLYSDDPSPTPIYSTSGSLYGDVDMDDRVDIVDALLIAQYYVGLNPENFKNILEADVNNDDRIDIVDALLVAQFYVGILPSL